MMLPFSLLATASLVPIIGACNLTIPTHIGEVVGFVDNTFPNVAQFLGIPFAEPPLGSLRFASPLAKTPVNDTIYASALGPSCPQYKSAKPTLFNQDAPQFLVHNATSEDCLSLNIWAPKQQNVRKLPVLVWLYGGAMKTGGAQTDYQIPSTWIERSQEHIVVGINYRVNIFGNANARGLNQSELNVGLLDQRLGIEWVRDNIASFGGDPKRITLWGQSAGAESTDIYNFNYAHDPIVAGLIMNSGTVYLTQGTPDLAQTNFTFVAENLGCGNLSAEAEVDCMRKVDMEAITSFVGHYMDSNATNQITFTPSVNNVSYFSANSYTAKTIAGEYSRVPSIIGTVINEGNAIVPYAATGANATLSQKATLNNWLCPAVETSKYRYAHNTTIYRYYGAANFSNIAVRPWEGAFHSSELPLIFGTDGIVNGNSTAFEKEVSHIWQDFYLAFIKDPEHGLEKLGWPRYNPNGTALAFARNGVATSLIDNQYLGSVCNGFAGISGASTPL